MSKIECFEIGEFGLLIHGGAGAPAQMTSSQSRKFHEVLENSLKAGWAELKQGAKAIDAVMKAVAVLEESPLFNAGGPGAVLNSQGCIRTDAGVMRGEDLKAGGVTDLRGVLHPSQVARLILEKSSAVLLTSEGAEKLARENGIEVHEDENAFIIESRRTQLARAKARSSDGMSTDHDSETEEDEAQNLRDKIGTVGVVAIDKNSNLCAVTSTGGRVNKPIGRVGDSPIPGAGYWADNESLSCSATGVGEAFLMAAAAKHLAQAYSRPVTIETALSNTLREVERFHGDGGFICITKERIGAWAYNTPAMYRGYMDSKGEMKTFIV
ncbi:beta-aspartyl-peptidase [bacterium]|nr:beta-aspartyl-peptidase [bacterium]